MNMNKMKPIVVTAYVFLTLAVVSNASSLEKKHQLGLRLGMWNQTTDARTEVTVGSVSTSVGSNGFIGGLSYGYWLTESIALKLDIGVMFADVSTQTSIYEVSSSTSTIKLILLGVKYYFPSSSYGTSVRPFASTSIGSFVGSQSGTIVRIGTDVTIESRTEAAFGGQIGAGVDFILGDHVMTEVSLGYDLMTDFNKPIGGSKNYRRPEFSFGLSYLLAKARQH
jgi:hypothetical protein